MLIALLALLALNSPLLWLARPHRWQHVGWLAALSPLVVTIWSLGQLTTVANGSVIATEIPWSEALGLTLALRVDGLGLFFGLIIAGIGTAIAIYAGYYFADDPKLGYFYALFFLFMTSMLGVVWADNLLALFIFWEGTSITSYLLISFKLTDRASLEGARRALIVTGTGAMALLAGMVLLAQMSGTYTISEIIARPGFDFVSHPLYPAALILILLGAFTKSAQFPFHFWLPGAMAAPTPVSAYLHSATMVKAGIYLLARLHPALSNSPIWFWSLLLVGGATMLLGAISALRYYDLKAILANATISQLGILTLLLAFTGEHAYIAVVVGILAHSLYKGPLFLVAGLIDHATGTRDIRHLAGLSRSLPWVAVTALLAALSMAGIPPTFGFLAKELLLEQFYELSEHSVAWLGYAGWGIVAFGGALFVAYSLIVLWLPFFRKQPSEELAEVHHAPSLPFVLPALLLAIIGLIIPFVVSSIEGLLFAPAASAIAGADIGVHLALWHGFTPVLWTSLAAIAVGVGIFLIRHPIRRGFSLVPHWVNGAWAFEKISLGLGQLARWTTRSIQGGPFAVQLSITLLSAVAIVVYAFFASNFIGELRTNWRATPTFYEVILAWLAIAAAIVTVRMHNRLSAIISIGVVGLVVTLAFVFFGAPDLALTQSLIEVLTVVLLVLVFYRIPPQPRAQISPWLHLRNLVIAGAVGLWGFAMVLLGVEQSLFTSISDYFSLNAVPAAHGGNIVNVILVDFRGFDTMGEITVLSLAAIGGYALLRASRLRLARPAINAPANDEENNSLLTDTVEGGNRD